MLLKKMTAREGRMEERRLPLENVRAREIRQKGESVC